MEAEAGNGNHQQGLLHRLLPAVLPVLLISIGYVDPEKWGITIEGGARFGLDLVVPMLLFNLAVILCQYLSARIGVVTGRDLAQICCDEYEKSTQIFLGVQAELSVIVLDLTMGVIDLAFPKPRSPMSPCFCLEIPAEYQKLSSPVSNGVLPPTAKPSRGKCTNANVLLDIIKDVELAISCRKGRSGTAAGDVAFPKGKENLASILKRYKHRLSNLVSAHDGPRSRKVPMSVPLSASYRS